MNVSSVTSLLTAPPAALASASAPSEGGFASLLTDAVNSVESTQAASRTATGDLLLRGQGDVSQVALTAQRAELTLDMFQQVRNKFVQAYQEIMKTPL